MERKPIKPKACKVCGKMFTPRRMGQKVCNPPASCMFEWATIQRMKERTKETKQMKNKQNSESKKFQAKKAQDAFNAYIRWRDFGNDCISCGKSYFQEQMQAGHYKNVGSHPELRFDEDNVHAQCSECNLRKSANLIEYRIGLIKKIGSDKVEALEGPHEIPVVTMDDLKSVIEKYQKYHKKLKDLKRSR